VSKAPIPSKRFKDFFDLNYPRKVVTIEPVLDFDYDFFSDWMIKLNDQGSLEYIWFGYNSKPKSVSITEPSKEKVQKFLNKLKEHGIKIRGKTTRNLIL
jgi:hypothetical protein